MPPIEASTTDTPSTTPPYADILPDNRRPALNATSDMPPRAASDDAAAEPVDKDAKPDNPDGTSGDAATQTGGEADGAPTKEAPGEEKDQTSPQSRAAFARERNRRQAAEQRAANLENRLDQLFEAVQKLTPKEEAKTDPRPDRTTFDDPNAYDKALEDWAGRRASEVAKAEAKADHQRAELAREAKQLVDTFAERKASFEEDHPDFDDVVYDDAIKISPAMSQAILEAEDGPAIAYYLGQNPEMADRISKLRPAQAALEIGRISTRLAEPPRQPKPAPMRPLASRNSAGPKSPDEMSMDEYAAHRAAKAKAN